MKKDTILAKEVKEMARQYTLTITHNTITPREWYTKDQLWQGIQQSPIIARHHFTGGGFMRLYNRLSVNPNKLEKNMYDQIITNFLDNHIADLKK